VRRLGVVLVLLLAAGCSEATPAEKVTSETADRLGEIRSGQLLFKLVAGAGDSQVGFQLEGPFALPAPGALPVARMDYTQIAGSRETTTQVIATGANAYVGIDGTVYQLPPAQVESLRAPKDSKDDGLGGLRIDDWVKDPQLSAGDEVDGVATERIQGPVDVVRTLNDLFAFGRQAGASDLAVPEIKDDDADQLQRVTESATLDLLTGKEDRLLRRMAVDIRLAAHVPDRVKAALGDLAAATIRFDLAVSQPNKPVQVPEPAGARPPSAIPGSG
jgi:hypothetical protein